jgi:hypothetical protein
MISARAPGATFGQRDALEALEQLTHLAHGAGEKLGHQRPELTRASVQMTRTCVSQEFITEIGAGRVANFSPWGERANKDVA